MAEGTHGASNSAVNLNTNNEEKSKITCICCAELELELEKTRTELRSAQKIVEILREEMFNDAVSKDNDNTNPDQNFETVIDKYRHKKSRNNKNVKCKMVMKMQHQTFPTTENKYSTLVNLHDEKESSKIASKIINTSLSLNKVSRKKRKLFILGDSHSRGMAAEFTSLVMILRLMGQ
jgi:hypothetical protein